MLEQIISGNQTGVERAALDVAGEFGVSHSLRKTSTSTSHDSAEQNVIHSDATLILAHGNLTGRSARIREMAEKYRKIFLHVDLEKTAAFAAVKAISYWINRHNIQTLHVSGQEEGEDPGIYGEAKRILASVVRMGILSEEMEDPRRAMPLIPATVEEAMDDLVTRMRLLDLTTMAKMDEDELGLLDASLGRYIRTRYGLWTGNKALLESCRKVLERERVSAEDASSLIVKTLWKRLQKTHRLRSVR